MYSYTLLLPLEESALRRSFSHSAILKSSWSSGMPVIMVDHFSALSRNIVLSAKLRRGPASLRAVASTSPHKIQYGSSPSHGSSLAAALTSWKSSL